MRTMTDRKFEFYRVSPFVLQIIMVFRQQGFRREIVNRVKHRKPSGCAYNGVVYFGSNTARILDWSKINKRVLEKRYSWNNKNDKTGNTLGEKKNIKIRRVVFRKKSFYGTFLGTGKSYFQEYRNNRNIIFNWLTERDRLHVFWHRRTASGCLNTITLFAVGFTNKNKRKSCRWFQNPWFPRQIFLKFSFFWYFSFSYALYALNWLEGYK